MTRPTKIALGLAMIWPLIFLGMFISAMIALAFLEASRAVRHSMRPTPCFFTTSTAA